MLLTPTENDAVNEYVRQTGLPRDATTISAAIWKLVLSIGRELESVDNQLHEYIGHHTGHGLTNDRKPLVTCYASTATYMLVCVSDGETFSFRVNYDRYNSPYDIPESFRKARGIAIRFYECRDLIQKSIKLDEERKHYSNRFDSITKDNI